MLTLRKPNGSLEWAGLMLLAVLLAGITACVWWGARYALAVNRLSRGVGDTIFYGADGSPGSGSMNSGMTSR